MPNFTSIASRSTTNFSPTVKKILDSVTSRGAVDPPPDSLAKIKRAFDGVDLTRFAAAAKNWPTPESLEWAERFAAAAKNWPTPDWAEPVHPGESPSQEEPAFSLPEAFLRAIPAAPRVPTGSDVEILRELRSINTGLTHMGAVLTDIRQILFAVNAHRPDA